MRAEPEDEQADEPRTPPPKPSREVPSATSVTPTSTSTVTPAAPSQTADDTTDDGETEDEEPKLKYMRLTASLGSVYRGGDMTSAFLVAGDKMILGTDNGNISVLSLPTFQPLRAYHAHSASVTAVSISPFPPPRPTGRLDVVARPSNEAPTSSPSRSGSVASGASPSRPARQALAPVPPTPSNSIFIATSSMDGHVCVSSLVDPKDVQLRNFGRRLNAVALSPEYKSDRSFLSGDKDGNLILTTGGKSGVSANANINSTAAAASGWLSSIGLMANTGRDTVLHSGEGAINTIKWSLSGRFVVWVNEQGFKIMRSNLRLESADADRAWKRVAHVDRPSRDQWEDMAAAWKAHVEWIDDKNLEADEDVPANGRTQGQSGTENGTSKKRVEKLVVGWGDTAWVLSVTPEGPGIGKAAGERVAATATILHLLRFDDCIISGLSLYTPSLLLVLAHLTHDENDNPVPTNTTPRRGLPRRRNGLPPELRLINVHTKEEVEVDTLTMKSFESLSAADYHLGTVNVFPAPQPTPAQRGAFEALSGGLWDMSLSATRIFSSGASTKSATGSGGGTVMSPTLGGSTLKSSQISQIAEANPTVAKPGLKVFIHSPYDCVLAVKRDLSDHLAWLLEHESYEAAWKLVDEHPEIVSSTHERESAEEGPATPTRPGETLEDFFTDAKSTLAPSSRDQYSSVEREKRRIGELWLQQLVNAEDWATAGPVAGRVLGVSENWERWITRFANAGRFDDIAPYMPAKRIRPPIPQSAYELVLGYYIYRDRTRLKTLLDAWDTELFDIGAVTTAIEDRLARNDIRADTVEDGEQGRDWRILMETLAKLLLADDKPKDALHCYVRLQNADSALTLLREFHLLPSVIDDIPGILTLRVPRDQLSQTALPDLEEAAAESITLLVDAAYQGSVPSSAVVDKLKTDAALRPFLFLYLRALWRGQGSVPQLPKKLRHHARAAMGALESEGRAAVDAHADLAVTLFADFDRELLMEYLRASRAYSLDQAAAACEAREFYPELVYVLSQTGETKRALALIINRLDDVGFAISFAKEQDDKDLWSDLLDYAMDKPRFIRGLLEMAGTAVDPVQLVRRIPLGLEIEGLREGIRRLVREFEIQASISEGVARVLRGEVADGMETLRKGRALAVKFEVVHEDPPPGVGISVEPVGALSRSKSGHVHRLGRTDIKPGHCAGCGKVFREEEAHTLVGFSCSHVFHLDCLLDAVMSEEPDSSAGRAAARLRDSAATSLVGGFDDGMGGGRSVGAKVAYAHVLRQALGDGCIVCRGLEEGKGEEGEKTA
ncbi:hypothetical protein EJ06DRAFT_530695 [Trichodelitschia bisporula]|uniref:Vps41 beta-propeller domain-containing protein n=1 Tax=Trichodelitschia bisporula TaxID=703511 RepID=A0A6G1HVF6_9PEZI|nr:hypothetical protein EJ06DRAFT_530695 [Trichodelitschia bisporula]